MSEEFPIDLLPPLVWEYVGLCSESTESPEEFHVAGALFVGSFLVGSWVQLNACRLNNYYLLVGDTGTTRKTTAQKYAIQLCREIQRQNEHLSHRTINESKNGETELSVVSPYELLTHFSVEGLQTLGIGSGKSTAIKIGEYASIFEVNNRKGQGNTIPELTDMYDSGFIKTAMLGRKVDAENYCLSLLAGSTSSWLDSFVQNRNVAGGFTNRHACFAANPKRMLPFQTEFPIDRLRELARKFSRLVPAELKATGRPDGSVEWSAKKLNLKFDPIAKRSWETYYLRRMKEMHEISGSMVADLCARELTHATKFTGLASCFDECEEVGRKHIEFGVRLARWCVKNLAAISITQKEVFLSQPAMRRVVDLLRKKPLSKQAMARALGGKQEAYNRAIEHLKIDGVVSEREDGLLCLGEPTPNQHKDEVDFFLGKTNISEICAKAELEVGAPKQNESASLNGSELLEERVAIIEGGNFND